MSVFSILGFLCVLKSTFKKTGNERKKYKIGLPSAAKSVHVGSILNFEVLKNKKLQQVTLPWNGPNITTFDKYNCNLCLWNEVLFNIKVSFIWQRCSFVSLLKSQCKWNCYLFVFNSPILLYCTYIALYLFKIYKHFYGSTISKLFVPINFQELLIEICVNTGIQFKTQRFYFIYSIQLLS